MQTLTRLFAEDAGPILWVIALGELLLGIALFGTGRGRFLVWMGVLAALALLVVMVEWLLVTDRERLDAVLTRVAEAARREDPEGLVEPLAAECRYAGLDREGIRRMATMLFRDIELDRVALTDRKIDLFPMRKQAKAEFRAIASGKQSNVAFNSYPTRWVLSFEQAPDGEWRVIDINQIQAFGEDRQPLPAPRIP